MGRAIDASIESKRLSTSTCWLAVGLVLCVLEGGVRKWLYQNPSPATQAALYFSKDVCFVLAGLYGLRYQLISPQVHSIKQSFMLGAFLLLVAAAISIHGSISVVGAGLTLRSLLVLPLLSLLAGAGIRTERDIRFLVCLVGFLAIGESILGILQFYMPNSHPINASLGKVIGYKDRVRATGTFSFIAGLAWMGILSTWAGLILILDRGRHRNGYIFCLAGVICALAAISRTAFFGSIGCVVLCLAVNRASRGKLVFLGVAAVSFWLVTAGDTLSTGDDLEVYQAIISRHAEADTVIERATNHIGMVFEAVLLSPIGHGIGSGQPAAGMETEAVTRRAMWFEGELARIVCEIGILGMVATLIFRLSVLIVLATSLNVVPGSFGSLQAVRNASLFLLALLFLKNTCFNHVTCFFAWYVVAIVVASFEIEARDLQSRRITGHPRRNSTPHRP